MADTRTEWQKRVGVGERSNALIGVSTPIRHRAVTAEEGPNRGRVAGFHTDHSDGRVDATVTPGAVTRIPTAPAEKARWQNEARRLGATIPKHKEIP